VVVWSTFFPRRVAVVLCGGVAGQLRVLCARGHVGWCVERWYANELIVQGSSRLSPPAALSPYYLADVRAPGG
jgi:hypothetical protein